MTRSLEPAPGAPLQVFRDRRDAGRVLAGLLEHYRGAPNVLVLGLACGGMPVAWEIAAAIGARLDVYPVRKLAAPGYPEFAMGAVAVGGRVVLNDDVVRALRVTPAQVRQVAEQEGRELVRRESTYRAGRSPLDVSGKTVILVDDGLATGSSLLAAVEALREGEPFRIVVAVPAAPESARREFGALVDEFVCAAMPSSFRAIGDSYWNFTRVTDAEVVELLDTPTIGPSVPRVLVGETPAEAIGRVAIEAPAGIPSRAVLADLIGDARVVLIGESTHGTREFYAARAEITKRLIADHHFVGVAVEADWPDAYRVNRFVCGTGTDATAEAALRGFQRFPTWMWRNTVVRDFADWLRGRNRSHARNGAPRVGFYGLDLYGMHRAMHEVVTYLDRVDPAAAARARGRYGCFDHVTSEHDGQAYGFAAAFGAGATCEEQVIDQLMELQCNASWYLDQDGPAASDEFFQVQRNAWTVQHAEQYYRAMFTDHTSSWNLRDTHMADTLDALLGHLDQRHGSPARIVVWAHNSHVGDARATELSTDGQLTLGQLARQRHGTHCRLIGLSTYTGTVTAASKWDGHAEQKTVRHALNGSVEELFHDAGPGSFLVRSDTPDPAARDALNTVRLARAIGVVYLPHTERQSHYYHVRPADQYDAMIHIDQTSALVPLEPVPARDHHTPDTFPSGI